MRDGAQKVWYSEMQDLKMLAEFRWHKLGARIDHQVGLSITYTRTLWPDRRRTGADGDAHLGRDAPHAIDREGQDAGDLGLQHGGQRGVSRSQIPRTPRGGAGVECLSIAAAAPLG